MIWLLALTGLEKAKMIIDLIKLGIDGWAVIDEQKRKRKELELEKEKNELEKRVEALEKLNEEKK